MSLDTWTPFELVMLVVAAGNYLLLCGVVLRQLVEGIKGWLGRRHAERVVRHLEALSEVMAQDGTDERYLMGFEAALRETRMAEWGPR